MIKEIKIKTTQGICKNIIKSIFATIMFSLPISSGLASDNLSPVIGFHAIFDEDSMYDAFLIVKENINILNTAHQKTKDNSITLNRQHIENISKLLSDICPEEGISEELKEKKNIIELLNNTLLKAIEDRIDSQIKDMTFLKGQIDIIEEKATQKIRDELIEHNKDIADYKNTNQLNENKIKKLEKQLSQLKYNYKKNKDTKNNQYNSMKSQLNSEINKLKNENNKLTKELQNSIKLKEENEKLSKELELSKKNLTNIEIEKDEFNTKINHLNSEIKKLKEENNKLRKSKNAIKLKEENEELSKELEQSKKNLTNIEKEKNKSNITIEKLNCEINKLMEENEELNKELEQSKNNLTNIEKERDELSEKRDELSEILDQIIEGPELIENNDQNKIEELQEEIYRKKEHIRFLQDEIIPLSATIHTLEANLEHANQLLRNANYEQEQLYRMLTSKYPTIKEILARIEINNYIFVKFLKYNEETGLWHEVLSKK